MKEIFKQIDFDNKTKVGSHFDFVTLKDLLSQTPADHSQFEHHQISFYVLLLVTEGQGTYTLNFKNHSFQKGTVLAVRKNSIHKFHKTSAKGILLLFTEDFIITHVNKLDASRTFLLFNEMLSSPKLQLGEAEFDEIMTLTNLIGKEYFQVKDDHSGNIVRSLVQTILTKMIRHRSEEIRNFEDDRYLPMFLDFQILVERDCLINRKVSYYADKMGVSSKTLGNVTRAITRQSPKSIINDIAIIQSKRLIINTQDSLTEIAYQVGFEEPTNFFKFFRKHTGVSPSRFREKTNSNHS